MTANDVCRSLSGKSEQFPNSPQEKQVERTFHQRIRVNWTIITIPTVFTQGGPAISAELSVACGDSMTTAIPTSPRIGLIGRILCAPWIWACGATWVFYQQIPHLPVGRELALRYFCGHPLERVLAGLFFVGLAIIAVKSIKMIFERRAFRAVTDFGISNVSDVPIANIAALQRRLTSASTQLQNTLWGHRLEHLLTFLKSQKSAKGIDQHLSYLSESAAERQHASHSLLQTVIWSIPILGFLGTVMGITLAIANVTPDQLDTSLDDVTNGLAVAFDTTALALSLSLVLGFASLFIRRAEESLLADIDERCRLEANRCFPNSGSANESNPWLDAQGQASQMLLEQTTALVAQQTSAWMKTLDELRNSWTTTLQQHQQQLSTTLNAGTEQTLANHAQQLAAYRDEFTKSQQQMTLSFTEEIRNLNTIREQSEQKTLSQIQSVAERLHESMSTASESQQAQLDQMLASFGWRIEKWLEQTGSWQQQMADVSEALIKQSQAILEHGTQLERIGDQEQSLVRLQHQLDQNLDTIRTAETFEQTLHNLTAAVNILTTRSRSRDAA